MAKADLIRFRELLGSDKEFQEKFRKAAESYKGEQNDKAVFEEMLLPLAHEYGLDATYEEFKAYIHSFSGTGGTKGELSEDELAQVAGGKGSGTGVCLGVGAGDLFGAERSPGMMAYACQAVGLSSVWMPV